MTIAACYISTEGVVLGADSTTTYYGSHFFNNSQKLFEIGEESTFGAVTWGLGGLQVTSHRTLLALLADELRTNIPTSLEDVALRWTDQFWNAYNDPSSLVSASLIQCQALNAKKAFDVSANPPDPGARTQEEESYFQQLKLGLVAGFCIGGHVLPDRTPAAFQILFDPLQGKPTPVKLPLGYRFWGAPNMIQRLLFGCDDELKASLIASGKWGGTRAELDALAASHVLSHPTVPIRDAIDFVHVCIYSTIKAFKFSSLSQICGGPIEMAVITTDRKFRWVRHKPWDSGIDEGTT